MSETVEPIEVTVMIKLTADDMEDGMRMAQALREREAWPLDFMTNFEAEWGTRP